MIIRDAFDVDVIAVLDDLSATTREELENFGKTPEDGAEYALRMIAQNGGKAGIINGKVVVVFGLDYSDPDAVFTWILATDAYFKQGASVYKQYRRFMKDQVAIHDKPIMSISGSKHPELARWFALSGARQVGKSGVATIFCYS